MNDASGTADIPPPPTDTLGSTLRAAREEQGLELSDVAEITHVRKEYLRALDEGRYGALPEPVYTRNFVRLYAQAVGLNEGRALALYARARHTRLEVPEVPEPSSIGTADTTDEPRRARRFGFNLRAFVPTLLTLLLVGVLVGVAVWAFRTFLFPPRESVLTPPAEETVVGEGEGLEEPVDATPTGTVLLSLETVPPGAEVSIDNYMFPGTTPIEGQPVTPGEERVLRVTMDGYETFERAFDFTFDRNLSVNLLPAGTDSEVDAAVRTNAEDGAADTEAPTTTAGADSIVVTVTAPAWLEVYAGNARSQGEILAFRTAQVGETLTLTPPVYIHTGNAGGVQVAVDGADPQPLGADGEVLGRAFSE